MKKTYSIRMVNLKRDGNMYSIPEYSFLEKYNELPDDAEIKVMSSNHFASADVFYELLFFDKDMRIGFRQSTLKDTASDEEIKKDIDEVYNDGMDDEVYAKNVAFSVFKHGPRNITENLKYLKN